MAITNTITSVVNIIRGLIDDTLRTDGRDSFIYSSDNIFRVTEDFVDFTTLKVYQNGIQLGSEDFSYDEDTNRVTVTASLSANDTIVMEYSYYKKYSNNEVEAYLQSSLSYFPQYQYKKTFDIKNDKIVAINGYNPTSDELYFIAIITSIVIDPQNIKISIPDLNISAKRDESDVEQIKKAFRNFKNFVGTIEFEEYINLSE